MYRLSLQDYLDKFDTPDNRERLVNVRLWVQNTEYLNKISEVAERRRSRSGSQPRLKDDENMNSADPDPVDNLLIEDPRSEPEAELLNTNVEKSKSSETLADCTTVETKLEPLDVSEPVDPCLGSSEMILDNGLSSGGDPLPSDAADTPTLTTLPPQPQTVDNKTKVYLKPPMSPELMIAIAVRNLDPNKEVKYCHNICICKLNSDEHCSGWCELLRHCGISEPSFSILYRELRRMQRYGKIGIRVILMLF